MTKVPKKKEKDDAKEGTNRKKDRNRIEIPKQKERGTSRS